MPKVSGLGDTLAAPSILLEFEGRPRRRVVGRRWGWRVLNQRLKHGGGEVLPRRPLRPSSPLWLAGSSDRRWDVWAPGTSALLRRAFLRGRAAVRLNGH